MSGSFLFHFQKTHILFVFCFPSSVRFNTPFVSGSNPVKIQGMTMHVEFLFSWFKYNNSENPFPKENIQLGHIRMHLNLAKLLCIEKENKSCDDRFQVLLELPQTAFIFVLFFPISTIL